MRNASFGFACFFSAGLLAASSAFAGNVATLAGDGTAAYAGDGGPATLAELSGPGGVAVAPDGTLFIADRDNFAIRKIDTSGIITTLAGGQFGNFGDGGQASSAGLSTVLAIALDAPHNRLYIADIDNNRIRVVDLTNGVISPYAGKGASGFGFAGDGFAATLAKMSFPQGIAVDTSGNLFIADTGNCRIRRVDFATNIISTIAGSAACSSTGDGGPATSATLNAPQRVTTDAAGDIFVVDNGQTVREISGGIINTIAGGGINPPGFGDPLTMDLTGTTDIAADTNGNLFIGEFNSVFKLVLATRVFSIFAGDGNSGFLGDGGPAGAAQFDEIEGITVAADGQLFIGDASNNRVRTVLPDVQQTPLFDLIVDLATDYSSITQVPGSVIMANINGRQFLLIPDLASVGLNVTITNNSGLLAVDLGALAAAGGSIDIEGNLQMTSLDLSSLTTVGGSMTISGDPNLSAVQISGITSITGDLSIIGTAAQIIDLSSLTTVGGSLNVSANTGATTIDLASLTTVTGSVNVDGNTGAGTIDLASLSTVGGSVSVDNNLGAGVIDLGSLTTVPGNISVSSDTGATTIDLGALTTVTGSVNVSNDTGATTIDLGSLTSATGSVSVSGDAGAGVIDLGSLTTVTGSVSVTGDTGASTIDLTGLSSVGGDVTVKNDGSATVTMGTATAVGGNLAVSSTGTGTFNEGVSTVGGNTTIDLSGYTGISGVSSSTGSTTITTTQGATTLKVQLPGATFTSPTGFTITEIDPALLPPAPGDNNTTVIDPFVAYQFSFNTPTLNQIATLSFDITVADLDPATQAALIGALNGTNTATMVTRPDGGTSFQSFPICTGVQAPTVNGCVLVQKFDAQGIPTTGTPVTVRFSNVVGHFSAWGVAIVQGQCIVPSTDLCVSETGFSKDFSKSYVRSCGHPIESNDSFTGTAGAAVLVVHNHGCASAKVTLNGVDVLTPNDLNPNVSCLTKAVTAKASNTIKTRVTSGPSCSIDVAVEQVTGGGSSSGGGGSVHHHHDSHGDGDQSDNDGEDGDNHGDNDGTTTPPPPTSPPTQVCSIGASSAGVGHPHSVNEGQSEGDVNNGDSLGGCSTTGASTSALGAIVLAGLALVRRRRR